MLKLVICDKDYNSAENIRKIAVESGVEFQAEIFTELADIPKECYEKTDCIIADISLKDEKNILFAEKLVLDYPELKIIFYTNFKISRSQRILFENLYKQTFSILQKPAKFDELNNTLKKISLSKANVVNSLGFVEFIKNRECISIPVNSIVYCEQALRKVNIFTVDNHYYCYDAIADFCSDYPFIMIHRSFAVNINHIKSYTRSKVVTDTGTILPISRNKKDFFYQQLSEYKSRYSQVTDVPLPNIR